MTEEVCNDRICESSVGRTICLLKKELEKTFYVYMSKMKEADRCTARMFGLKSGDVHKRVFFFFVAVNKSDL